MLDSYLNLQIIQPLLPSSSQISRLLISPKTKIKMKKLEFPSSILSFPPPIFKVDEFSILIYLFSLICVLIVSLARPSLVEGSYFILIICLLSCLFFEKVVLYFDSVLPWHYNSLLTNSRWFGFHSYLTSNLSFYWILY